MREILRNNLISMLLDFLSFCDLIRAGCSVFAKLLAQVLAIVELFLQAVEQYA